MPNLAHKAAEMDREIGERIRVARLIARQTQQDLASSVGLSYQQIQKYETGANRVAVSTLVLIAGALGVSPVVLLPAMPAPVADAAE